MPTRRWHNNSNHKKSAGFTQRLSALSPSHSVRRAPPALPGRIPQEEEAELFLGVTKASAEPKTGVIPLGPSKIEIDVGTFRLGSIRRLSGGFSHQASDPLKPNHASICSNKIPLRRNNNNDHSHPNNLVESVSDRGHGQEDLDRSGIDSTSAICGSSDGDYGARQGAKEPTIFTDSSKTDYFIEFTCIDNIVSHQIYTLDKPHKIIVVHEEWDISKDECKV